MKQYITKSGDTWDSIAYQIYGHENMAKDLIEANTAYIHTVIFAGGIMLEVPDTTLSGAINLPPWKVK